jgi:signal transduction histidine kinase
MEIQVDKLTRLVTDLLDVTRIAQGKLLIEKKPINVDELVEDTVETMKETTKGQKFQITLGANVQVEGDSDRLSQVIINLLSNAIKYSLEEKPIVVTTKKDEKNAYIAVKDYGYGISSNDLQKIFERFYRVADNPIRPGLGIGLYVSMEIMKMHGGNITVESVPGEGSTFTMTIPLLK